MYFPFRHRKENYTALCQARAQISVCVQTPLMHLSSIFHHRIFQNHVVMFFFQAQHGLSDASEAILLMIREEEIQCNSMTVNNNMARNTLGLWIHYHSMLMPAFAVVTVVKQLSCR